MGCTPATQTAFCTQGSPTRSSMDAASSPLLPPNTTPCCQLLTGVTFGSYFVKRHCQESSSSRMHFQSSNAHHCLCSCLFKFLWDTDRFQWCFNNSLIIAPDNNLHCIETSTDGGVGRRVAVVTMRKGWGGNHMANGDRKDMS